MGEKIKNMFRGHKEKKKNQVIYPSVAYELGAQITERTGQEVRVTVPAAFPTCSRHLSSINAAGSSRSS